MPDINPPEPAGLLWPSGVGGAQCDRCGETTIVRRFGGWDDSGADDEWVCRECAEGNDNDDDSEDDQ